MAKYNTVFHQILPFFRINSLDKLSRLEKADKWVKKFFNKHLLVTLIYGMLARKWSLRLLESSLNPQYALRRNTGLPEIHRTTISKALEDRSPEIFQKHFFHLLNDFESKCFSSRRCGKGLSIVDSTAVRMPPNLCDWADFKRGSKEIKFHILMESTAEIPEFCKLSLGTESDITVARSIVDKFPDDRILVADNGYFAYDFLQKLNQRCVEFIIPVMQKLVYKVEKEIPMEQLPDNIVSDQIVTFTSQFAKKYKLTLRLIVFRNPEDGELFTYITNCWELESEVVIEIYRQRWKIEIFFRWIKQNLKIKSFWGTSKNAVEIQVWIALMVYLVVRVLALISKDDDEKSPYYLYHFLRDKLFERTNLKICHLYTNT